LLIIIVFAVMVIGVLKLMVFSIIDSYLVNCLI